MKLITNKGKVLGIINIIDLIILIMVILMGFIFYKYVIMLDWEKYDFGELSYEVVERTITIELSVLSTNYTLINAIIPGMQEIYRKQVIGFIIDKQIIQFQKNDSNLTTAIIKIKSNLTKIDNDLYYNIQMNPLKGVKIGDEFVFNSEKIKLTGIIVNIE